MSRRGAPVITALALALLGALAVFADPAAAGHRHRHVTTHTIGVGDDYYSKDRLTVRAGDRVTWAWQDTLDRHNVTLSRAPKGVKRRASPTRSGSFHYTVRFSRPGRYAFHCSVHPFSMRLDVRVKRASHKSSHRRSRRHARRHAHRHSHRASHHRHRRSR